MKNNVETMEGLKKELENARKRISELEGAVRCGGDEKLREERERAQKLLDVAGVMIVLLNSDGSVDLINKTGASILGLPEKDITGKNWFDNFIPSNARERVRSEFKRLMAGEVEPIEQFENTVKTGKGEERLIAWRNTVLRDSSGRVYATLSSGNDVTEERKAAEELSLYKDRLIELVEKRTEELRKANEKLVEEVSERRKAELELKQLSAAIEHSVSIVFIMDSKGAIDYANPKFEEVSGYSKIEAIGAHPCDLFAEEGDGEWKEALTSEGWQGALKNRKKDGSYFWSKGNITPIKNDEGSVTNYLAVFEDITEKRLSAEKLEYLSHYDSTTGLLNRSRFIELLNDWIKTSGGSKTGALFLLDIDQFKFVCDSYGHGMGDEFLRKVGKLLQMNLRYIISRYLSETSVESIVCRLSGDEFAVFLPGLGRVEAVVVAEEIRKGLEGFYQADVPCHMTASIGVALYPEHGKTTTELLTRSDAAMYRAKDLGRNRFHFYSPDDRDIEQMHTRLKWKENILLALKEDRFEAWLQPILDLKEKTVRHYEVLARMRDREGGIILPGPFIDIAERFGLVGAIARVIIEKAMILQARTQKAGNPMTFCINISGKELGDRELLYYIQSKLYETGADPDRLIFEITETASINDLERAIKFLKTIKSAGCHVSLDDFGIGFTSFLYLKEMQVDYIKIAGPFIKNIEKNLNDRLFVRAITDVARGMGIKTIAEFVETEEAINHLIEIGVDYAQGYLIGRPAPSIEAGKKSA